MQLILDKITVPSEVPLITRTRLLRILRESLASCTSTIITGRAGTGKTLLAADFARRCGRNVAWYKIEALDGEWQIFFRYLAESVRRERTSFNYEALMRLVEEASGIEDVPLLAEAFVYELQESSGDSLLIIVDDLHLIYDAEWIAPFFCRLLPLLPSDAHLLITGRSLLPAPLWRMRSKQTLCVAEELDLAFTLEEAKKLFECYGLTDDEQINDVLEETHGRAGVLDAVVCLMAASERTAENLSKLKNEILKTPAQHVHGFSF